MHKWGGIVGVLLLTCSLNGQELPVPSTQFYDRAGLALRQIPGPNNLYYQPVQLADISPWLIAAVVAAEDKRFYTHSGVDVAAVLRAAWQNTRAGEVRSGASTLTVISSVSGRAVLCTVTVTSNSSPEIGRAHV